MPIGVESINSNLAVISPEKVAGSQKSSAGKIKSRTFLLCFGLLLCLFKHSFISPTDKDYHNYRDGGWNNRSESSLIANGIPTYLLLVIFTVTTDDGY